jgi:hypothetical protein
MQDFCCRVMCLIIIYRLRRHSQRLDRRDLGPWWQQQLQDGSRGQIRPQTGARSVPYHASATSHRKVFAPESLCTSGPDPVGCVTFRFADLYPLFLSVICISNLPQCWQLPYKSCNGIYKIEFNIQLTPQFSNWPYSAKCSPYGSGSLGLEFGSQDPDT